MTFLWCPVYIFRVLNGSKTKHQVGYAVIAYNHADQVWTIKKRLEENASIFEAESRAIAAAIKHTLSSPSQYQNVAIFSDCQSALASIDSYSNVPYCCYETQKLAEQLGRKSDLHLLWTPGYKAIAGNEIADCLVKRAAANTRLLTALSKISFKLII